MNTIHFKDISLSGPVEICEDLCNALMYLQAERSVRYRDILSSMNFNNRLKPAFCNAEERFLYVAFDEETPVGYIFCEKTTVTEESKGERPDWAAGFPADSGGFYADDMPVPTIVAHLNNLYILPEYRGRHISAELMEKGMKWMRQLSGVRYIYVHVSNGNNAGSFYEKYGFRYSHDVFNGLIDAYKMECEDGASARC